MHLGDLPLEIQSSILRLCSRRDIAALSRTHASLRDAAEYALYSSIHLNPVIVIGPHILEKDNLKLPFHTLTTNPRKASMVKSLHVMIYPPKDSDHAFLVMGILAEALEKTTVLGELSIMLYGPVQSDLSRGRIGQVIRSGCFTLHSLCLEHFHDIEGIVADQPHLRVLAIFTDVPKLEGGFWKKIADLRDYFESPSLRSRMPTIFTVKSFHAVTGITITMLPSFYRPGDALEVCREAAKSISKLPVFYATNVYCLSLSLLGISEKNIDLAIEMMGAMAACMQDLGLPRQKMVTLTIIIHQNSIQAPWRLPDFLASLVPFKHIENLTFYFPDVDEHRELFSSSAELELYLKSNNSGHDTWPSMCRITFHPGPGSIWLDSP